MVVFDNATKVIGGEISASGDAYADNNSVTISGGTVGEVIGGDANNQSATSISRASGNIVTISGGTVTTIYGGLGRGGESINNTVTLTGTPNLNNASIYGGYMSRDDFTGNRLNVHNYSGTGVIDNIQNFQYFNFLLPDNASSGDPAVLTANTVTLRRRTRHRLYY